MVIGNGIELILRRILMTWLNNANITRDTNNYRQINEIISFILEEELTGKNNNMLDQLYNVVCPELVKNSAEIFADKVEEQAHYPKQTKEILIDYFELLELTTYGSTIPEEVKNIFKGQVVNYFDTFISKSILLWHVNIENILKYFINNYRCLKTFIELH